MLILIKHLIEIRITIPIFNNKKVSKEYKGIERKKKIIIELTISTKAILYSSI